ncbi:MAG: SOS response-associated peptidase [Deltaproteobacteria bacterium]|nr:SOS response-associated peptidase [Deltaproteobacteria bacterium]
MCFSISLSAKAVTVKNRYGVDLPENSVSGTNISAFTHPKLPVLVEPAIFISMNWGLVPLWVKSREQAKEIQNKTLNARSETVFEKPSFKDSAQNKRCIIPVTSFQEWHHHSDKSKTKYDIQLKDEDVFSLAGIWSKWTGPASGKEYLSFSIITCPANPLMAEIHNSKQRMPVILSKEDEEIWINPLIEKNILQALLVPFDETKMEATLAAW